MRHPIDDQRLTIVLQVNILLYHHWLAIVPIDYGPCFDFHFSTG
jgi:hypothetical protein